MGMTSQVGLCMLLDWKSRSTRRLSSLSMQKMSITRDKRAAAQRYQDSMNSKVYKFSNNAGVTYADLSYANLMRPGNVNQNKPYLITNRDGKIVIDDKYQKYAEMISPDGSPGDWEAVRNEVLSEITGIPIEKFDEASTANDAVYNVADRINELLDEGALLDDMEKKLTTSNTADKFLGLAGNVSVDGASYNIANLCRNTANWTDLGSNASSAKSKLTNLLNSVAGNLKNYLTDDEFTCFTEACKNYMDTNGHYFGGTSDADKQGLESGIAGIKNSGGNYSVNLSNVLQSVLGAYQFNTVQAGLQSYGTNSNGTEVYYTRDRESAEWKNYETLRADWQARYDSAIAEHKSATNTENQIFTADEESKINFYDELFSAIAECGWVVNSQINDNEYLNNMLQNNQYFITTVSTRGGDDGETYLEFNTDIASNCSNIFPVNDSNFQNEALVQYEAEKAIINEKESSIDQAMQNEELKIKSFENMIKGREAVRDKNIETFFSIM